MNGKTATLITTAFILLFSCTENRMHPDESSSTDTANGTKEERAISKNIEGRTIKELAKTSPVAETTFPIEAQSPLLKNRSGFGTSNSTDQRFFPHERLNKESYNSISENGFINADNSPLSTFSVDVDTASYTNIRRFVSGGRLPPIGAVRTEELINYFPYQLPEPAGNEPFNILAEVGPSPFNTGYRLVKIGLSTKQLDPAKLPPANLVFLIDVSGSMQQPLKLPLLKQSMKLLVKRLGPADRVSIIVYAGSDHIVLEPTPGDDHQTILNAIKNLHPGGSTHASKGIVAAYKLARQAFIPEGNNRIILASDGDFNVGITSRGELQKMIESQRKSGVFLTVLGFGTGNYHDDTMEVLADKGNGNYAYIDSLLEAKKVLVKEMSGTLFTLANDVKIQVEFNPAIVGAYRLIGYENRALADEDFIDDTKDAGEVGIGHTVTALYEIIPVGHKNIPEIDPLKYKQPNNTLPAGSEELLTIKLRYKPNGEHSSRLLSLPVQNIENKIEKTSEDFRFAAAVAGYAMLLRDSKHRGIFSWNDCLRLARGAKGKDSEGYRAEFCKLIEMSQLLKQNS